MTELKEKIRGIASSHDDGKFPCLEEDILALIKEQQLTVLDEVEGIIGEDEKLSFVVDEDMLGETHSDNFQIVLTPRILAERRNKIRAQQRHKLSEIRTRFKEGE